MNENIIITGASSSIGNMLIDYLIKFPVKLYCQYSTNDKELRKYKEIYPDKIFLYKSNFNRISEINNFSNKINTLNIINAFVHLPSKKVEIRKHKDIQWKDFSNHITIQVGSLHIITSKIINKMKASSSANIVVLGSIGTQKQPPSGMIDYLSSKGMLAQYCKCMNSEYSSKGVKTTLISPSMFKSPLLKKLPKFIIEKNTEMNGQNLINIKNDLVPIIKNLIFNEKVNIENKYISIS